MAAAAAAAAEHLRSSSGGAIGLALPGVICVVLLLCLPTSVPTHDCCKRASYRTGKQCTRVSSAARREEGSGWLGGGAAWLQGRTGTP